MKSRFMHDYIALLKWREDCTLGEFIGQAGVRTKEWHAANPELSIPYCVQLELAVNKFFASQGMSLRVGFDKSTYKFLATTP